jgi:8-oxo-dGTP pyrophosphatase MutT (NUDIX family)
VEEGEEVQETALREVREETGLEGELVAKLGEISYWYMARTEEGEPFKIFKHVYFYLFRYLRGDVREHDEEVDRACWVPISKAADRLSFRKEREMVQKVASLLGEGSLKEEKVAPRHPQGG